jgi:hypothetical protein
VTFGFRHPSCQSEQLAPLVLGQPREMRSVRLNRTQYLDTSAHVIRGQRGRRYGFIGVHIDIVLNGCGGRPRSDLMCT